MAYCDGCAQLRKELAAAKAELQVFHRVSELGPRMDYRLAALESADQKRSESVSALKTIFRDSQQERARQITTMMRMLEAVNRRLDTLERRAIAADIMPSPRPSVLPGRRRATFRQKVEALVRAPELLYMADETERHVAMVRHLKEAGLISPTTSRTDVCSLPLMEDEARRQLATAKP